MKNFILIASSILFFSCTPQKNVTSSTTTSSSVSDQTSKGVEMYGRVIVKSKPSANGQSEVPSYYFDDGVSYQINFAKSKVSKADVQKYLNKDIDIVGEVKIGDVSSSNLTKSQVESSSKEESYIIIYSIL